MKQKLKELKWKLLGRCPLCGSEIIAWSWKKVFCSNRKCKYVE